MKKLVSIVAFVLALSACAQQGEVVAVIDEETGNVRYEPTGD